MADFNSDRQGDARRAYGDAEQSKLVHGRMMETFNVDIRKNGAMRNRAAVLGALAGLCTAASAAGVVRGAPQLFCTFLTSDQSAKVLAWVVSSGVGLVFCVAVSFANERAVYDLELKRELWEIDNHLSGELLEMISIYRNQGLSEEEAHVVTRIFAKQKHLFAALMMVEELGYSRLEPPTTQEVVTNAVLPGLVGYVLALAGPMVPVLLASRRPAVGEASSTALVSSVGSSLRGLGLALIGIGTTLLSCLQSEVFFGAYASKTIFCKAAVINAAGVGAVYAMSYAAARML